MKRKKGNDEQMLNARSKDMRRMLQVTAPGQRREKMLKIPVLSLNPRGNAALGQDTSRVQGNYEMNASRTPQKSKSWPIGVQPPGGEKKHKWIPEVFSRKQLQSRC